MEVQTLDALGWTSPVTLIGHSFGQGVATLVAGSFPDRVNAVVLIEGLGIWDNYHLPHRSPARALRSRITTALKKRPPKVDHHLRSQIDSGPVVSS